MILTYEVTVVDQPIYIMSNSSHRAHQPRGFKKEQEGSGGRHSLLCHAGMDPCQDGYLNANMQESMALCTSIPSGHYAAGIWLLLTACMNFVSIRSTLFIDASLYAIGAVLIECWRAVVSGEQEVDSSSKLIFSN